MAMAASLNRALLAATVAIAGVSCARPPAQDHARAQQAAAESTARLDEWLGAALQPRSPIYAAVPERRRSVAATMDVESLVAFAAARARFPEAPDARSAVMLDGAAWYLQSRIVPTLYDYAFFVEGHSADRVALFGGLWVEAFEWLPLDRWTAGIARGRQFADRHHGRARGAAAFATLERYLTWPVLQSGLRAWAHSDAGSIMDASRLISDATAYDLDWFFEFAFDAERRVDYAVVGLASQPGSACLQPPCYRTTVTTANRGNAAFSGTSLPPSDRFGSGDAVEILVGFADGSEVMARWDGRAAAREFHFESAAEARFAVVDPRRVIVMDDNYLNNRVESGGRETQELGRWTARWLIWLQDAMLTLSA